MENESCEFETDYTEQSLGYLAHLANSGDEKAKTELDRRMMD